MKQQKDYIYFATIARALRRFSPDCFETISDLQPLLDKTEKEFSSLIDEAEFLSTGIKSGDSKIEIPNVMMKSLLQGIDNDSEDYRLLPQHLSLSKKTFPLISQEMHGDYSILTNRMKENLINMQKHDIRVLAENMLQLLFRYASFVPSNKKDLDISLYDQTRVAAAIAVCLYEVYHQQNAANNNSMMIIGADFSGIQSYIYEIVSKHAGKNLKGRSFYLRLLSDAVVGHFLKQLDLYQANVIYDSGGCFYILSPNTPHTKDVIESAIQHIERQLFETHGTSLFIAIDYIEISKEDITYTHSSHGMSEVWQSLFIKRDKKKYHKHSQLIAKCYNEFFLPKDVDGKKRDAITGQDFSANDQTVRFNENQLISVINAQQIKIGQKLKECDCILVSDIEIDNLKNHTHIHPANIGRYYYLLSINEVKSLESFIKQHPEEVFIKMLNGKHGDCDFLLLPETTHCPVILEFYGGNSFNEKTFEQMCDNDNLSRLGILRMDVDNLGSIFQSGIPKDKACLARYAALSRSFDYFFSGYINSIILDDENVEKSFIIYSGGDDLFIVGEWNSIIRIAKTIREDFREYTCNNPTFSISGGVAILTAKFPIISGAEESAFEESNAKNHTCKGKEKDSISFMDTALNWGLEFPAVEKLKDSMLQLLTKGNLSKSFLSKILLHASTADIEQHKIRNVKTYWMMSYDLKRIIERSKSEEVKRLAFNCQKEIWENKNHLNGELIETEYHLLELWAFACRWAELEYRMLNK